MAVSRKALHGVLLLLLLAFTGAAGALHAQSSSTTTPVYSASAVRAAFLVNFARFTEWPPAAAAAADEPIVFGVVEEPDLEDSLWKITTGQRIQGHPVRVKRLLAPTDILSCHVVYLGSPDPAVRSEWLAIVADKPVLTISSSPGFLDAGGHVLFYYEGQNLRFEINVRGVQQCGLVPSSRLLALSRARPTPAHRP